MIRSVFVFLHRWVGLLMATFLVIVGLTGSLLAFNNELEHVFASRLFAKPHFGEAKLDLATRAERANGLVAHAHVASVRQSGYAGSGHSGVMAKAQPARPHTKFLTLPAF
ncbi:PepSY domain-containing protein [Methylosinus sporium]|uniref:PepSY domain-containing protein n=1 Tax=Methylosinus sporium TaxID=428 RepID=UPI003839FD93